MINPAVNPTGKIDRKIANEAELLKAVHAKFPSAYVIMTRMESLGFRNQLELAANADILVGMHGAALTHALFLPPKSGLFELVPKYWTNPDYHFRSLARWRHLYFARWRNYKDENEDGKQEYTTVPPEVFTNYIEQVASMICRKRDDKGR